MMKHGDNNDDHLNNGHSWCYNDITKPLFMTIRFRPIFNHTDPWSECYSYSYHSAVVISYEVWIEYAISFEEPSIGMNNFSK